MAWQTACQFSSASIVSQIRGGADSAKHTFFTSSKCQFFHFMADRFSTIFFVELGLDCGGPPPSYFSRSPIFTASWLSALMNLLSSSVIFDLLCSWKPSTSTCTGLSSSNCWIAKRERAQTRFSRAPYGGAWTRNTFASLQFGPPQEVCALLQDLLYNALPLTVLVPHVVVTLLYVHPLPRIEAVALQQLRPVVFVSSLHRLSDLCIFQTHTMTFTQKLQLSGQLCPAATLSPPRAASSLPSKLAPRSSIA